MYSNFEALKNFVQFNEIKRRFGYEGRSRIVSFEHEPVSNTIVATKSLFDPKYGHEFAMVGLRLSYAFLNDFWLNATKSANAWSECFQVWTCGRWLTINFLGKSPLSFGQLDRLCDRHVGWHSADTLGRVRATIICAISQSFDSKIVS